MAATHRSLDTHIENGFPMRKMIVFSIAAALALSACNTVAGVGRDAQSAGKAVTKAAKN